MSQEYIEIRGARENNLKDVSLRIVMYIFNEPSIGMHPRDVHRLNELLQKLRDKGNTVLADWSPS